jgi:hypothetical protein
MSRYTKDKSSKYKGVSKVKVEDGKPWMMHFVTEGLNCAKRYVTEKDAAGAYDIKMMEAGRLPVNIYTPR